MNFAGPDSPTASPAARDMLRESLARADRALGSIPAVLGHLVASEEQALFSDEVVARTRGMVASLAQQLVRSTDDPASVGRIAALVAHLSEQDALLAHCHALAIEAQLAERLSRDHGLDPVLTPLMQDIIAAPDADSAALAMNLLAAQARFVRRQRRMEAAVEELPADLLNDVLAAFVQTCGLAAERPASLLRDQFDEGRSRTSLLARVLLCADGVLNQALDLDRAGVALFASALSLSTGTDRSRVILGTVGGQQVRLILLLASCGLSFKQIEAVSLRFHPDAPLSGASIALDRDTARTLLAEKA